jgi:hypothetical protein
MEYGEGVDAEILGSSSFNETLSKRRPMPSFCGARSTSTFTDRWHSREYRRTGNLVSKFVYHLVVIEEKLLCFQRSDK